MSVDPGLLRQVLDLVKSTVGDQRVKVDLVEGFDPLTVSSYSETSFGFQILKKTVLDVFLQVTVAPGEESDHAIIVSLKAPPRVGRSPYDVKGTGGDGGRSNRHLPFLHRFHCAFT